VENQTKQKIGGQRKVETQTPEAKDFTDLIANNTITGNDNY
jgi:hypothetical protein